MCDHLRALAGGPGSLALTRAHARRQACHAGMGLTLEPNSFNRQCLVHASGGSEPRADPSCPVGSAPCVRRGSGGGQGVGRARDPRRVRMTWPALAATDAGPRALRRIAAHPQTASLARVLDRQSFDAPARPWPVARADAKLAIGRPHIAPGSASEGLMAAADCILPDGGLPSLYGPFRVRTRQHDQAARSERRGSA